MPREEWTRAEKRPLGVEFRGPFTDPDVVETIEGDFEVDEAYIDEHGGFVIIRGVDGEVYPCALDIFRKTYLHPRPLDGGPNPTPPACPECKSPKTRALDDTVATCFECSTDWRFRDDA